MYLSFICNLGGYKIVISHIVTPLWLESIRGYPQKVDSSLFDMMRHTILHVMTHQEHDVTHFAHGMTHQLHVATHLLHNTTHPNPLNALSDVACSDRGSVWDYKDPFRIFNRIVL